MNPTLILKIISFILMLILEGQSRQTAEVKAAQHFGVSLDDIRNLM